MEKQEWLVQKREQKQGLEALNIKKQWASQMQILFKYGIVDTLHGEKLGITAIDGKQYPIPQPEEIMKRLEQKKEIVLKKMEQGFTKLLMVPLGYSFDALVNKYEQVILKHSEEKKIFGTKEDPNDKEEPLQVDWKNQVSKYEVEFVNGEIENKMVYFPKQFLRHHGGKFKRELLLEDPSNAWNVLLIQDLPNIPRRGKGFMVGGRFQLETNKTPEEYLHLLQTDPMYTNESGFTPEADIMYGITRLEETNEVINDYIGRGSIAFHIGAYFVDKNVSFSYWSREGQKMIFSRFPPIVPTSVSGIRTGVMI